MIIEIARGHIRLQFGGRIVTIEGEAYASGYGSPNFVAYRSSIRRWDPPYESLTIDDETKGEILIDLASRMKEKGMSIEIE